jgi:hypothetical protein
MSRKLSDELEEVGCEMTPTGFREMLEEQKAITSPAWSIDDLVCHPDEAKQFCDHIRATTNCPKMSDFFILRQLQNSRKSH